GDVADDAGDEFGAGLALAHRVHGQVVDHRVQLAGLGDPGEGVAGDDARMRAVEGAGAEGWQVLAAQLHDPGVDLDHGQLGRQRVQRFEGAEQLGEDAAVATAEDGHALEPAQGQQGAGHGHAVGHVGFGDLQVVVEEQLTPEARVAGDDRVLHAGMFIGEQGGGAGRRNRRAMRAETGAVAVGYGQSGFLSRENGPSMLVNPAAGFKFGAPQGCARAAPGALTRTAARTGQGAAFTRGRHSGASPVPPKARRGHVCRTAPAAVPAPGSPRAIRAWTTSLAEAWIRTGSISTKGAPAPARRPSRWSSCSRARAAASGCSTSPCPRPSASWSWWPNATAGTCPAWTWSRWCRPKPCSSWS